MRTDQLALRLEDSSEFGQVWAALPPDHRASVARVLARLCVRAAKVCIPVSREKGRSETWKQRR